MSQPPLQSRAALEQRRPRHAPTLLRFIQSNDEMICGLERCFCLEPDHRPVKLTSLLIDLSVRQLVVHQAVLRPDDVLRCSGSQSWGTTFRFFLWRWFCVYRGTVMFKVSISTITVLCRSDYRRVSEVRGFDWNTTATELIGRGRFCLCVGLSVCDVAFCLRCNLCCFSFNVLWHVFSSVFHRDGVKLADLIILLSSLSFTTTSPSPHLWLREATLNISDHFLRVRVRLHWNKVARPLCYQG